MIKDDKAGLFGQIEKLVLKINYKLKWATFSMFIGPTYLLETHSRGSVTELDQFLVVLGYKISFKSRLLGLV